MANANVNDVILVTFEGRVYGQKTMLTHTYALTTVTGVQNILTVQSDILARISAGGVQDIETSYALCLQTSWACERITAQRVTADRMRKSVVIGTGEGSAGPSEASNLATALTFNSIFAGRDQISTKHIGPLAFGTSETLIKDGVLTDVYKELIDDLGSAMLSNLSLVSGAVTASPCIAHRNPTSGEVTGFTLMDNYSYTGIVSSQRTRIIGKGQ